MKDETLYAIVDECLSIDEFDRTPEQQAIVELHHVILTGYEELTGEKIEENA